MKTHVTFVLDSSGSMEHIEDDTKGGFNLFLKEQQEEDGEATVTLYEFNTTVELLYQAIPIEKAPKLTTENYRPSGRTALHDAIARAATETQDRIDAMPSVDRPDNVIVVVLTDGKENASETTQETVRELVSDRQEDGWEFLFVGANQDAALTAEKMNIDRDQSLNMAHSGEGAQEAYRSTSRSISRARRDGQTGGYHDEDRRRQEDLDDS